LIQGKDIIVTGIIHWELPIRSNCQDLAWEFSKQNRVIYVFYPLNTATKNNENARKRLEISKSPEKGLVKVNDNFYLLYTPTVLFSINWLPKGLIFSIFNFINAWLFCRDIKKVLKKLHFRNDILFNDTSMFLGLHLKELLRPVFYVYYMRDNMMKVPFWAKHGLKTEPKVIAKADLVACNSEYYAAYGRKYNPHSYMVGQGCDVSAFDETKNLIQIPDEAKKIKRPVIGYIGTLWTLRLEIELIGYIARSHPEWSIVLIGPEDEKFQQSILHQLDNVYFIGKIDLKDVPAWVKAFDVAINPQIVNDITIGNYPRKIDEYLAMGKAVVATRTEAMDYFREVVYLADNKDEFVRLIEKALEEDNDQLRKKRKATGFSHSWENNVNEIYKYINLISKEKGINLQHEE